ncbi:hypothetical protein SS50377_22358 [Spironucleus salmonicida]|uniref:Uncharacterized protein n=1 Tax=Spironucleus salmonicida TaxID=348837 RepID=V6LCE7_9EUKA|nr:hypothetical protein SS50377_22358 [Spironucleus salmonicida]|eukprot:EST42147.1 Hypothetical protein SS50377_18455 [Spironucleus salmonicida]
MRIINFSDLPNGKQEKFYDLFVKKNYQFKKVDNFYVLNLNLQNLETPKPPIYEKFIPLQTPQISFKADIEMDLITPTARQQKQVLFKRKNEEISKSVVSHPPSPRRAGSHVTTQIKLRTFRMFESVEKIYKNDIIIQQYLHINIRDISLAFMDFTVSALHISQKQPQFTVARFGVSQQTLNDTCTSPQDLFCLFVSINTNVFDEQNLNSSVWHYLKTGISQTQELEKPLLELLNMNNSVKFNLFCRLLNECFKCSNDDFIDKLAFLNIAKNTFDCQQELREFIKFVGKTNIIEGKMLPTNLIATTFFAFLNSLENPQKLVNVVVPEPKIQHQSRKILPQELLIENFNENILLDFSQFIDFHQGFQIVFPSMCQQYACHMLQAVPKPVPNALIKKLREVIDQHILGRIQEYWTEVESLKTRNCTVQNIYDFCKKLLFITQHETVITAEAMLVSSGRVSRISGLKESEF